jgi:hypothetical protein
MTVKFVRITASPDPDLAPRLFEILAGAAYVTESRLYDVSTSPSGRLTGLFEIVATGSDSARWSSRRSASAPRRSRR